MALIGEHTDALADILEGEGRHERRNFQIDMAQADQQTDNCAERDGDHRAEEAHVAPGKFAVEHETGKQRAGHADQTVDRKVDRADHNDERQTKRDHERQRHLVENIQQVARADERRATGKGKDDHKQDENHDRRIAHDLLVLVVVSDFFGEFIRDGRRRIQFNHILRSIFGQVGSYCATRKGRRRGGSVRGNGFAGAES